MTAYERMKKIQKINDAFAKNEINISTYVKKLNEIYEKYFALSIGTHMTIEEPFMLFYLEEFVDVYKNSVQNDADAQAAYLAMKRVLKKRKQQE